MEQPDANELVESTEVDVRTVSIIWVNSEPLPQIDWSGCSVYEAIGLAVAAAISLSREYPIPLGDEEEEDDY